MGKQFLRYIAKQLLDILLEDIIWIRRGRIITLVVRPSVICANLFINMKQTLTEAGRRPAFKEEKVRNGIFWPVFWNYLFRAPFVLRTLLTSHSNDLVASVDLLIILMHFSLNYFLWVAM